jgi:hypothetical protein
VFRRLVQNLRFADATESRGDEELFDEAFALRMNETDPVVRRRLVSRMRLALEAEAPPSSPTRRRCATTTSATPRPITAMSAFASPSSTSVPSASATRGASSCACALPRFHPSARSRSATRSCTGRSAAPGARRARGPVRRGLRRGRVRCADRSVVGADPVRLRRATSSSCTSARRRVRSRFEEVRDPVRLAVIAERRAAALERGLVALRAGARVVIEPPPG